MKVWAMPVQRPYMPNAKRTAELMQEDFAKVGVKVEIVSYEWGEYLKKSMEPGRDGAVILGWTGDNGDPDNFMGVLLSCAATTLTPSSRNRSSPRTNHQRPSIFCTRTYFDFMGGIFSFGI